MRLLASRNYRYWAAADLVSVTGTWMQVLGVNWFVLRETGSATHMGLTVMLHALPVLLLGPYGGALADRLPVRRMLLLTQAAHAALAVALTVVVATGAQLGWIYAISVLAGVVSAVDGPALGRFGGMVSGPRLLGKALANGSLISSTGRIAGMSVGGVVVAAAGPAALFAANAVSFLAVIGALLAIRARELHPLAAAPAAPAKGAVRAGFRYLATQPVVLVTLAVAFVLGSLGRNYQVTMAAMSDGPLAAGPAGYGALSTVFAAGTVAGALLAGRLTLDHRLLVAAGVTASVLQMVAGVAPSLWTFAAALVPIAAAAVIVDTTVSARIQLDTRDDMRGRALAATAVVGALAGIAGAPVLGLLCETIGARGALLLAGAVGVLTCTGAALWFRATAEAAAPAGAAASAVPVPA
ncbi:MFS transporter [Dactylosporangium aurantiacum]|uniref:MFS transporter n=1 Tax=Dactylosporangium aurantiacum TaxID=35754 RepID=UPI0005266B0E